ncbi:MAG: PBP1A family penicillin-binding protein [Sphingomonadales bacterium]|nr:PBP1A family penicillin-binding protein [Sphingomonadales bacterium]
MARSPARQASPPPRRPAPRRRRWLRGLLLWLFALALLAAGGIAAAVAFEAQDLPSFDSLKSSQNGQTIVVRARDGTQLVSLGPSYGRWLSYDQIPEVMTAAIVSTEDRRYREHFGIDPIGIVRSVFVRVETHHWRQGGSTLTQQLARTVFLNNNRTFTRKIREALLAMALEHKFTKDQILELYLNKVYFGGGAYGIDAASRKFFNHSATRLSLPEAAIIAGLVKAPSHYSPTSDVDAATTRAHVVLDAMREAGAISREQEDNADLDAVHIAPEAAQNSVRYFTDWALPQLDMLLPDNKEPIEVWTTLDLRMQNAATRAMVDQAPRGAQGALVSLDRDGAVLALVGGTDYVSSNYNRAVKALRQPGSAWKLFVYLAALENGVKPGDAVIDQPVNIDGWSPQNSGRSYAGQIDVRTAFAYSKNTVAAQLGQQIGFSTVADMARRFGITTPINTLPSMVLGANDVRLIDMTRAFAAVEARGTSVTPYGIEKVTTTDGRVLYEHPPIQGQTLVAPYVAAEMTDLLQTAVSIGTGRAAQIGRPVAGKTGTTSSNKDGWFLGFSSGITTGVWMGRDDARPVPGLQGGTAPARAFAEYMRIAVADRPVEQFETQVTLPGYQIEPDDEATMANPDSYFYDDQGNLVSSRAGTNPGPGEPPRDPADEVPPTADQQPDGNAGAAAGDQFLDQATGRQRVPQTPPRRPPPSPRAGQPIYY